MIKNIIFDFDGVICESVNIKTEAFYEMYLPYGEEVAQRFRAYHLQNGGLPRYDKFRYFQKELLGTEASEAIVQDLADQFSSLVMEKVIKAPFVSGALEFLQTSSDEYLCFIVSATPMKEMQEIADKKKIKTYFREIYGSPTDKSTWVRKILDQNALRADETLFIGDALSDYRAAKTNKTHFLLRRTEDNKALFDEDVGSMYDLIDLPAFLERFE